MKDYNKILILMLYLLALQVCTSSNVIASKPITTDSRIKTFVYNENEVFRIVLHYGYQTSIEFADGEEITTISVGNNYAWQLSPVGRRLFIKPLEDAILTNMTIITNKHTYQFELQSKLSYGSLDDELVYVVRFFYPDDYEDSIKPQLASNKESQPLPSIKPYNFNYSVNGSTAASPSKVFDDGTKTFFYFEKYNAAQMPSITSEQDSKLTSLHINKIGKYFVVSTVAQRFKILLNGQSAEVTNNELLNIAHGQRK